MTTLIPIGGGADNDGWTPEARRACAFDRLGKAGGKLAKRGKVLFHTDFESGELEGWRQHYHSFEPRPAIGLTTYPVRNGGYAMMVGTSAAPYNANDRGGSNGTYKNLSLYGGGTGVVSFSGWTCLRSGIGTQAQQAHLPGRAWRSWAIMLDIQRWMSTSRSFPQVSLIEPSDSTMPKWYIRGNSGLIAVPDSEGAFSGENENKYNWDYWRLSWDLDANGGLGGYLELQVNDRLFDLTNLGGGSAVEPPQEDEPIDSFSGGFNCGLSIQRSTKWTNHYPATLFADDLVCTVGDIKA